MFNQINSQSDDLNSKIAEEREAQKYPSDADDPALRAALGRFSHAVEFGTETEPWPLPEPLGGELPPVPTFDENLLPGSIRGWCIDIADRMQAPLDFAAVTAIFALAAATMRRAEIQPKANDSTWTEVPNLWGGLVAGPGQLKSPTVASVMAPLRAVEAEWLVEYQADGERAAIDQERAELAVSAWKQQYVSACKRGADAPARPDTAVVEPTQRRLLTSDATYESLHKLMAENPKGIACLRDELTGWLAGLERQGRESERSFALESWNGHGGFTVDRIGRGSVNVENCCMALFGGIQPGRIRSYLADALKDGPSNDGLIQRFQLIVWPDTSEEWRYVDRKPNEEARQRAEAVYRRLVSMNTEKPLRLRFDDAAQQMFIAWLTDLECRIRADGLSAVMQAHLAKYRKLMPALALLFSLADGSLESVSLKHARLAAAWCEYLEPHARRVYASGQRSEVSGAQAIAKRLQDGWKRDEGCFTLREVYRSHWAGVATPDEARTALDVLCENDWLRKTENPGVTGRPTETYTINPRIVEVN